VADAGSQAFQELAKGERTASALENHLTALERKIDELLAQADEEERNLSKKKSDAESMPRDTGDEDKGGSV